MPSARRTLRDRARSLGRPDVPFMVLTVAGVAAVLAIGLVMVAELRSAGIEHERREAAQAAELSGRAVVAPLVSRGLLAGRTRELARIDAVVRKHVLRPPVVRVKLWAPDGRVLYSDEPRLIGRTFPLQRAERALLTSGGSTSELSELSGPENRFERGSGRLFEVYTRVRGPDGTPVLFETYQRFESIAADGLGLWRAVLPALVVGLLLLELVNLLLVRWFTAVRRRGDRQRAALLKKALDATNAERRRIAADLHDGVVQDLTAASLTVTATTVSLREGTVSPGTAEALETAGEALRGSVGTLRTLLIDFYPADLESRGLAAALGDLVALARADGLVGELWVPRDFKAPPEQEGILFRFAQEALRNVQAHARASRVSVSVRADADTVWLEVRDDGRGFDPDAPAGDGHIGLRVLHDLLADVGGRVVVESRPGAGTLVRAAMPLAPARAPSVG